jgi:lipoteichoic acid synthase
MTGRLAPGTNVIIVVMESVGARNLELYGARYHDTPNLIRLAHHAADFTRMYASMPHSSSAIAALFSSLYPRHSWPCTTADTPGLPIPSLASVLDAHGYRAGFIHAGSLSWDHEGEFLRRHGFEVEEQEYQPESTDQVMLNEGLDWIERNRGGPFLLVLWTKDTHAPYSPMHQFDFGVKDAPFGRYLDAVASSDALIGQLAARLDELGLAGDTVLIVTGDHGEAFGEHGQLYHDVSAYDEEVRTPLLIVSPRLFPNPLKTDLPAQEIDLAPTVVDLLGYQIPPQWQGRSLFAPDRAGRIYLFADVGFFRLAVIDGPLKYMYDYNLDQQELYDLSADPYEQRNLIDDPAQAGFARRAHQRLTAWLAFQNDYLDGLARSGPPWQAARAP